MLHYLSLSGGMAKGFYGTLKSRASEAWLTEPQYTGVASTSIQKLIDTNIILEILRSTPSRWRTFWSLYTSPMDSGPFRSASSPVSCRNCASNGSSTISSPQTICQGHLTDPCSQSTHVKYTALQEPKPYQSTLGSMARRAYGRNIAGFA